MIFDDSYPDIIDSNGQKYMVGWDDHGWFSIVAVEATHTGWEIPDWATVSSFPPGKAERIAEIIND